MKCPICGEKLRAGTVRCPGCGYRTVYTAPESQYAPRSRPSRKWLGCCFVPLALFLLLFLIGIFLAVQQVAVNIHSDIPIPEPAHSVPVEDTETVPAWEVVPGGETEPAPTEETATVPTQQSRPGESSAAEGCFTIDNGTVTFLPERWDGSPVLQVPDTVDGQPVISLSIGCFRDCRMLTTIILPDSLKRIRDGAFSGCKNLRGLFLPDGVVSIGSGAFDGCLSLEAVYIPDSVVSIASGAFDDCASLHFLFYDGTFEDWNQLYSDFINPFTTAACLDGFFYHGAVG